jgi:hypothetical protein
VILRGTRGASCVAYRAEQTPTGGRAAAVLGLDIPQRRRFGERFRSSLAGSSSAVLGCVSWSPGETERRLCAASCGSETGQETWPPEFFSEPLQRGNSRGMSLTNDFPLYLRRVFEMTSDRPWRTWRNTSSFARTRRCGATGWTDGTVPIQSLKHQIPRSSYEPTVCGRIGAPTAPNSWDVVVFTGRRRGPPILTPLAQVRLTLPATERFGGGR